MPATRNQRALAGEPLADGDTPEYSPRTQERLAAVQAAELQLVAEDKKYQAALAVGARTACLPYGGYKSRGRPRIWCGMLCHSTPPHPTDTSHTIECAGEV